MRSILESLLILGSITLALMLGAISPGPTFIYVAKNSIAISRKHGLFTALGTGTGAALFGLLAVMGVTSNFAGCAFCLYRFESFWWFVLTLAGI